METSANPSLLIVDDDISFVRAAAEIARSIPFEEGLNKSQIRATSIRSCASYDKIHTDLDDTELQRPQIAAFSPQNAVFGRNSPVIANNRFLAIQRFDSANSVTI